MKQRKKRNVIIGILCCMIVFMGVGYAILSQNLKISGTANVTGSWNIYIDSIGVDNTQTSIGAVSKSTIIDEGTKTTASFISELKAPGDYITYNVTVKNAGTIDAILESLELTPKTNEYFLFETKGIETGEVLNAKEGETPSEKTFQIKITFKDSITEANMPGVNTEVNAMLMLNYQQVTNNNGVIIPDGDDFNQEVDYILDSNGMIVGVNESSLTYDSEGYLIIPATNSMGENIKAINYLSLRKYNVILYYDYQLDKNRAIVYSSDENEFNNIKTIIMNNKTIEESNIFLNNDSLLTGVEEYEAYYADLANNTLDYADVISSKISLVDAIHLTTIGEFTFADSSIEAIKLNDNITRFEEGAFQDCSLSEIILPNSLTYIGNDCFQGSLLSEVEIPASVNTIGSFALADCENLTSIVVKRANSDGMTLGSNWSGNATVTYNPN